MPRDLEAIQDTIDKLPPLHKTDADRDGKDEHEGGAAADADAGDKIQRDMAKGGQRDELHPYVQTLNLGHLDSICALEQATFPPEEGATREKIEYRLTVCGELCLGLFTSVPADADSPLAHTPTASHATTPESSAEPPRKEILLAHILATKTPHPTIADDDMAIPPDWRDPAGHRRPRIPCSPADEPARGHREYGRTIALHSLAVLPECQGKGLGSTLLTSYVQRMHTAGLTDRIALLARPDKRAFYERFGFEYVGDSPVRLGGGGWVDMVLDFVKIPRQGPMGGMA